MVQNRHYEILTPTVLVLVKLKSNELGSFSDTINSLKIVSRDVQELTSVTSRTLFCDNQQTLNFQRFLFCNEVEIISYIKHSPLFRYNIVKLTTLEKQLSFFFHLAHGYFIFLFLQSKNFITIDLSHYHHLLPHQLLPTSSLDLLSSIIQHLMSYFIYAHDLFILSLPFHSIKITFMPSRQKDGI